MSQGFKSKNGEGPMRGSREEGSLLGLGLLDSPPGSSHQVSTWNILVHDLQTSVMGTEESACSALPRSKRRVLGLETFNLGL